MGTENDFLQAKQFAKDIKASGGNFKVHTRSGIFEAVGVDAAACATQLINTRTISFGPYTITPDSVDVIEKVEIAKETKTVGKGNTSGVGSKSGKGLGGDSEAK